MRKYSTWLILAIATAIWANAILKIVSTYEESVSSVDTNLRMVVLCIGTFSLLCIWIVLFWKMMLGASKRESASLI